MVALVPDYRWLSKPALIFFIANQNPTVYNGATYARMVAEVNSVSSLTSEARAMLKP